jgi:hypothetical protein
MLVAEQHFGRITGYRDLATLVIAVERHAMTVKGTAQLAPATPTRTHRSPPRHNWPQIAQNSTAAKSDDDPDILLRRRR